MKKRITIGSLYHGHGLFRLQIRYPSDYLKLRKMPTQRTNYSSPGRFFFRLRLDHLAHYNGGVKVATTASGYNHDRRGL